MSDESSRGRGNGSTVSCADNAVSIMRVDESERMEGPMFAIARTFGGVFWYDGFNGDGASEVKSVIGQVLPLRISFQAKVFVSSCPRCQVISYLEILPSP